jgi:hypothetical protein
MKRLWMSKAALILLAGLLALLAPIGAWAEGGTGNGSAGGAVVWPITIEVLTQNAIDKAAAADPAGWKVLTAAQAQLKAAVADAEKSADKALRAQKRAELRSFQLDTIMGVYGASVAATEESAIKQALDAAKVKIAFATSKGVNVTQSNQMVTQSQPLIDQAAGEADPRTKLDLLLRAGQFINIIRMLLANVPDPAPAQPTPQTGGAAATPSPAATAGGQTAAALPILLEDLFQAAVKSNTDATATAAIKEQHDVLAAAVVAADKAGDKTTLTQKRTDLRTLSAQFILDTYGQTVLQQLFDLIDKAIQAAQNKIVLAQANGVNVVQSKQQVGLAVTALAQAKSAASPVQAIIIATTAGQYLHIIDLILGDTSTYANPATGTPNGPVSTPAPNVSGPWTIETPRAWDYQPTVPSQSACASGEGTTYEIGQGLAYTALGQVPWTLLKPCDTVNIHWQPQPYSDVIAIGARGAKDKFIRIQGIPGPNGEKPILDGSGAAVAPSLFANPVFDGLGMIEILPPAGAPYGYKPGYLDINNLEIRGADMKLKYTNMKGQLVNWNSFACGIYIERAENVAIRNNEIHDNSQGLFQNSKYDEFAQSRYLLIEGNYIHDNGNPGSNHEHNAYTEGVGTIYQFNWFGAPKAVSYGENIKDRSVGITFRYNYIESGITPIKLEDPESNKNWEAVQRDAWGNLLADSVYIYGNTLIMGPGQNGFKSPWGYTLVSYGDGTDVNVRGGNIYFFNNTVISKVDWGTYYFPNSTLFQIINTRNNPTAVAQNNIFYATSATTGAKPAPIALFYHSGSARFSNNWISPGWVNTDLGSHSNLYFTPTAPYNGLGISGMLTNAQNDPGFVDAAHGDYRLRAGSPGINAGTTLDPEILKTGNTPLYEFKLPGLTGQRKNDGTLDLGAFEY